VPLSHQGRERLDRLIAIGESTRSPFPGRPSKLAGAFRFDPKNADPNLSRLDSEPTLQVFHDASSPADDVSS
jgi:hypothetical protein